MRVQMQILCSQWIICQRNDLRGFFRKRFFSLAFDVRFFDSLIDAISERVSKFSAQLLWKSVEKSIQRIFRHANRAHSSVRSSFVSALFEIEVLLLACAKGKTRRVSHFSICTCAAATQTTGCKRENKKKKKNNPKRMRANPLAHDSI